jgi:hypothetical protein
MSDKPKFTPGPWEWQSFDGKSVFLGTPNRGRLVVMDFVRDGFNGACPRFAANRNGQDVGGIMMKCGTSNILSFADARLIAAAPRMYKICSDITAPVNQGRPIAQGYLDMIRELLKEIDGAL